MSLGSPEVFSLMTHIFIVAVPIGLVIAAIFYFKGNDAVRHEAEVALVKIIWVVLIVGMFSVFIYIAFGDPTLFNSLSNIGH